MLYDSLRADRKMEGRRWTCRILGSVGLVTAGSKKGAVLLQRMVDKKTSRLHALAEGRAEEVRFHRWLSNPRVSVAALVDECGERLWRVAQGRHVLAIQDTTELNYQHHAGRVRDLGPVGNGKDIGLLLHPVLAVDAKSGLCLGLIGAEVWTRSWGKVTSRRHRRLEEKESRRWVRGGEMAKAALPSAERVTLIDDREGDIFEKWAALPGEGFDLMTRAAQDRSLANGQRLFRHLDRQPVAHRCRISVPRKAGLPAREATVELRFTTVTLRRPARLRKDAAPATVRLQTIDLREVGPVPSGATRIHWRLLTTHAVPDAAAALQIVNWYRYRWHIEQLFWTLKRQGLDIEASQLETAEALKKLAIMATKAATRVMQLVRARDGQDSRPASDLFDNAEIEVIEVLQNQLQGRTQKQKNPFPPLSLAWAAWTVARLGGWKGYPSESPPGPITMKRGLTELTSLTRGYHLARSVQR